MSIEETATITPIANGPLLVKNLKKMANRSGPIETEETMALCRCGGSASKPFCDGTHKTNGFSSANHNGRVADRREDYRANNITIHDNRHICSHAGHCTDNLAAVFRLREEPWIHPDAASQGEIIKVINRCPSGALSYSIDGREVRDRSSDLMIYVSHNGPYEISGKPVLCGTKQGEGASAEHYTLCRCGGSQNKPFCDGTHWSNNFADDRN